MKTTKDVECGDYVRLKSNPTQLWRVKEIIDKFLVHLEYEGNGMWFSGGVMDVSMLKHE